MFNCYSTPPAHLMMGEIQNYEKIVNTIYALWGDAELNNYLDALMCNSRMRREGFPAKVFNELNAIRDNHRKQYPQLNVKIDVWA